MNVKRTPIETICITYSKLKFKKLRKSLAGSQGNITVFSPVHTNSLVSSKFIKSFRARYCVGSRSAFLFLDYLIAVFSKNKLDILLFIQFFCSLTIPSCFALKRIEKKTRLHHIFMKRGCLEYFNKPGQVV